MFVFHFGTASLSLCLFGSHRHFFLARSAANSKDLAYKTTGVEDTYFTLASSFSISSRGEQIFNFFAVIDRGKKIAEFLFL